MSEEAKPKIAVVGCGIVGLSTALCLQKAKPGIDVTIFADRFLEKTTSYGAAGIIRCSNFSKFAPNEETGRKWFKDTFNYMANLAQSPDAGAAGVSRVSGYFLHSDENDVFDIDSMKSFTKELYHLNEDDVQKIAPNNDLNGGVLSTTFIADSSYYLRYIQDKFIKNGGKIQEKTVKTLAEFAGNCDIVVNCTGLRAKTLVGDNQLYPIRGQVFKVIAPWIKQFYYRSLNTYIIPGVDYVTVGGTRQLSDTNTNIDPYDSAKIFENACKVVPSLKNAKVAYEWAGLRPQRDPIRVEKEIMKFGDAEVKVVHNYGHGGYGVTLSWGTALEATSLILDLLKQTSSTPINHRNIPAKL